MSGTEAKIASTGLGPLQVCEQRSGDALSLEWLPWAQKQVLGIETLPEKEYFHCAGSKESSGGAQYLSEQQCTQKRALIKVLEIDG